MNTCVIGVDSSTTATKVVAFDLDGTVISMSSCQIESFTDMPGRVEQDAARWWESLCIACRSVVDSEEVGLYSISGLAITHQRFTFVPVDDDLRPLRRAILWNDRRCAEEATYARSIDVDGSIYRRTGYPPGQWSLYKLLWLKNHEPALYEKTHRILLVHDYLAYHLTGELATSESTAAMTGALDIEAKSRWAIEVMEQVDVRNDVWVTPILSAGTPIGSVTMEASRQTGLPRGLPVIAGAGDQPCGSLGAGIVAEGQLGINGGTSCSNEFVSRDLPILERPDYFVEINPAGGYLVENDIPSGGSAVANWYRDRFHREHKAGEVANKVWNKIYGSLAQTIPGNHGFMIVPYLQGVYGPYWDQNATAVSLGMRHNHGQKELIRALLEGVAYESRREVDLIREGTGIDVEEIRMYGGSVKSEHWNRLFADMYGATVLVPKTAEATALGAAIIAAVGSGAIGSFEDAVNRMTGVGFSYDPEPRNTAIYDRFYRSAYLELYDRVSDLVDRIARINQDLDSEG